MPIAEPRYPNSASAEPTCETPDTAAPSSLGPAASRPWPAGFKLTIVVPVFNEQQTVAEILRSSPGGAGPQGDHRR